MLVLSRKPGESVIIGDGFKVTILEVGGDRVKVGIDAPKEVRIVREEVLETEKSNIEAVLSEGPPCLDEFKDTLPALRISVERK